MKSAILKWFNRRLITAGKSLEKHAPAGSSVQMGMQARIRFASSVVERIRWGALEKSINRDTSAYFAIEVVNALLVIEPRFKGDYLTGMLAGLMVAKKVESMVGTAMGEAPVEKSVSVKSVKNGMRAHSEPVTKWLGDVALHTWAASNSYEKRTGSAGLFLGSSAVGSVKGQSLISDDLKAVLAAAMKNCPCDSVEAGVELMQLVNPVLPQGLGSMLDVISERCALGLLRVKGLQRDEMLAEFTLGQSQGVYGDIFAKTLESTQQFAHNMVGRLLDYFNQSVAQANLADEYARTHLKTLIPDALVLVGGSDSPIGKAIVEACYEDDASEMLLFASGLHASPQIMAHDMVKEDFISSRYENVLNLGLCELKSMAIACLEHASIEQALAEVSFKEVKKATAAHRI